MSGVLSLQKLPTAPSAVSVNVWSISSCKSDSCKGSIKPGL